MIEGISNITSTLEHSINNERISVTEEVISTSTTSSSRSGEMTTTTTANPVFNFTDAEVIKVDDEDGDSSISLNDTTTEVPGTESPVHNSSHATVGPDVLEVDSLASTYNTLAATMRIFTTTTEEEPPISLLPNFTSFSPDI